MPLLARTSAKTLAQTPARRGARDAVLALTPPDGAANLATAAGEMRSHSRTSVLDQCANTGCRSGWLRLWRNRTGPVFEGGWTCSAACTEAHIAAAVARECEGREAIRQPHRHRVPIGLVLLEQGWITKDQLRRALDAQKAAGAGRVGQWLLEQSALEEERLTRAMGLQWSCPVLSIEHFDPTVLTGVMPRLFVDAFGALPLRLAANRLVYLGFEDSLDPVLALGLERMSGLRVETGLVHGSRFRPAHARMLDARFPPVDLIEAASPAAAAHALARSVERARPGAARLVRVHDCLWLRMWERAGEAAVGATGTVRDLVCSIGPVAGL